MAIQNIAVLGAGQMGNGITQVAAAAGYNVTMVDIQQEYVDKGLATIERSLGKLMNESVFMSGNMHRPEELDFYVPLDSEEILENALSLLQCLFDTVVTNDCSGSHNYLTVQCST